MSDKNLNEQSAGYVPLEIEVTPTVPNLAEEYAISDILDADPDVNPHNVIDKLKAARATVRTPGYPLDYESARGRYDEQAAAMGIDRTKLVVVDELGNLSLKSASDLF